MIQAATAGATAVQIHGDGNTVRIVRAGAELALRRLHQHRVKPTKISELLRTDIRATALVGRAAELQALADWRAAPQRIAVKCIIGGAGAGKTRLAIEACEAAESEGWAAAFAPSEELARFHAGQNLVHWALPTDALIVIDYAATSLAVLKSWFTLLAPERDRADGRKLRILLLERHADVTGGWWADLARPESRDHAGPGDLIGDEVPYVLPTLDVTKDRRALLTQAMQLAAPLLDPPAPPPSLPAPGEDRLFDQRLALDRPENQPLYLLMAGVYAARHGAPTALALDRGKLAEQMAGIEIAHLEKFAKNRGFKDSGKILKHLAACVTLQGGCSPSDLPPLVEQEAEALGALLPFSASEVAEHLCDYLPQNESSIEPIRPDLIGETFLLPIVEGGRFRSEPDRQAIIRRAYERAPVGTTITLIRCAQDLAAGRADHAAVKWLSNLIATIEDYAELVRLSESLPESTLSFRELALDVQTRIANLLRASYGPATKKRLDSQLAAALNNLANRLSDLGHWEQSLEISREAVDIYEELAADDPEVFTSRLAAAVSNLAYRLDDLGKREEALEVGQKGVQLYRALVTESSDEIIPSLAMALNNLATYLRAVGQFEKALDAAREAVELYRKADAVNPGAFTADLAMSLNTFANRLSDMDQDAEALDAAQESVRLYRALAADKSDAFTPRLASALNNLSTRLGAAGLHEDALNTVQEAVQLRRVLAAERPDVFNPDLASSLHNLASRSKAFGRREKALAAAYEAVQLRRSLATDRPDAFSPDLAMSLSVLADALEANERLEEALTYDQEAISMLAPRLYLSPPTFARPMMAFINDYFRRAGAAGSGIDAELVGPIVDCLDSAGFSARLLKMR